jgi:chemotaxis protein CheX
MNQTTVCTRLQLPAVMDMNAAAPLAAELVALRGQPVALDASAVERVGGLCLQVLLSARVTWAADGAAFTLERLSGPLQEALALAGAGHLNPQPRDAQS